MRARRRTDSGCIFRNCAASASSSVRISASTLRAFPTAARGCVREKRRTPATVENAAVPLQPACSQTAVDPPSLRQIPSIRFPFRSIKSCCLGAAGVCCLSGKCLCPSRLLSRARSTKDPGHHSRFVQSFLLLLAAAAPALGVDGVSCGNLTHRVEPLPRARGCAGCALCQTTPVEGRAERRTALRGCTV